MTQTNGRHHAKQMCRAQHAAPLRETQATTNHSKLIRTISGLVPMRIGGPQVPAPHDV